MVFYLCEDRYRTARGDGPSAETKKGERTVKTPHNEKYFKWGLTAFLVFVACSLFWIIFSNLSGFYDIIKQFINIISSILFGFLFAYLMNPVMEFVRKNTDKLLSKRKKPVSDKFRDRFSLTVGIVAASLVFVAAVYALIALIVPSLIDSLKELLSQEKLESYYNAIAGWIDRTFSDTEIEKFLNNNLDELRDTLMQKIKDIDFSSLFSDFGSFFSGLTYSVYNVVMFVFNVLLGMVAAVYILIYKRQLCAHTKKITVALFRPEQANRLFEIARRTNRIFGGYVIGKILDAIIVGVLTYIGMLILKLPYAPLISVIVGVTNIIPFFGPLIGMVPSALLLLIDNPINSLKFLIFILILQQIDGNIIQNRILGEKLGISDFWVLVAIMVFGGIFGVSGMLLGVPIFAVLYTLVADWINKRLRKKRYPVNSDIFYSLQCVEDLPIEPSPSASFAKEAPAYDMKAADNEDGDYDDDYDE